MNLNETMKKNNPIIPGLGICDPHIHIFNNTAYLYASHDRSAENTTWLMSDWQIWSSKDLVTWHYESTVRPEDTYIGTCERCWAVDAAERNGKYYYYFSNGNTDIGAAIADGPAGPFRDALGHPLLTEDCTSTLQYDPTAFVDPDSGIPYLIWGCDEGDGYYMARLCEDMVSLAEEPRQVIINGAPVGDDKSFLHKKNETYYLSWGSFYATAKDVYGPYEYRGTLGISEDHGSFFSWNGQDFYAYTIFDPHIFYRSTGICYIHYKENGEMAADQMIAEYGVGIYDGNWNKIQAKWFMKGRNIRKQENIWGGFDVAGISSDSELFYPNIRNMGDKSRIHFLAASKSKEAYIEVWDAGTGKQIGCCRVTGTGSYDHRGYRVFDCGLNRAGASDTLDLRLRFRGEGDELMRLCWFKMS